MKVESGVCLGSYPQAVQPSILGRVKRIPSVVVDVGFAGFDVAVVRKQNDKGPVDIP
jgi:hypothetical protein